MFNYFAESGVAPALSDAVALTGKKAGVFDKITGKILYIALRRRRMRFKACLACGAYSILPR